MIIGNFVPCHGPILVLTLVAWWLLGSNANNNMKFRAMPWPDFSSNARGLVAVKNLAIMIIRNFVSFHGPILVLTLVAWWLLRSSDNDYKKFRAMPWHDF